MLNVYLKEVYCLLVNCRHLKASLGLEPRTVPLVPEPIFLPLSPEFRIVSFGTELYAPRSGKKNAEGILQLFGLPPILIN